MEFLRIHSEASRGIFLNDFMKKSIYDKPWSVYMAQCRDGVLYTGIALDVVSRIREHNATRGCRYTRYRKPVLLVYSELCDDYHQARRREYEIKQLPRKKKLDLISR